MNSKKIFLNITILISNRCILKNIQNKYVNNIYKFSDE